MEGLSKKLNEMDDLQKVSPPINEDNSIIDWTFESSLPAKQIEFDLKESLNKVFRKLCLAVSGEKVGLRVDIDQLVSIKKGVKDLDQKIQKIKSRLANENQFKRKVEMNLELIALENKKTELSKNKD